VSDVPFPRLGAIIAHLPYIEGILEILSGKNGIIPHLQAFGRERVLKQLEAGASRKDIFYHLVCQCIGSADVHLTKTDYRVVRNSLKQSAPPSIVLPMMAC